MRKFKLQIQVSIDGYMAAPDGQPGGIDIPFTDDMYAAMDEINDSVDCIVLGRNIADGFITAWAARPQDEPDGITDFINDTAKVVISNTLTSSSWENTVVAGGDIVATVNELKSRPGGDLIAYGGGTLVASLLAHDLVDDLYLFVNPVAYGGGMPVFGPLDVKLRYRLAGAQPFESGITALHYQPLR